MGRPLNIDRLGGDTAAAGTQLQAKAYVDGAAADASVIQQKSQYSFVCKNGAAETAECRLVDKAVGSLADGEMSITASAAGGTPAIATPTGVTLTESAIGGVLLDATVYGYRVSAINATGETLASTTVSVTTAPGATGTVSITVGWDAVAGATGYKVYGRTAGGELLMATLLGAVLTFVDDGSVTPSGALPSSNTTATSGSTFRIKKITNRFCWDFSGNRFMWTFGAASGTGHDSLVTLPSA